MGVGYHPIGGTGCRPGAGVSQTPPLVFTISRLTYRDAGILACAKWVLNEVLSATRTCVRVVHIER